MGNLTTGAHETAIGATLEVLGGTGAAHAAGSLLERKGYRTALLLAGSHTERLGIFSRLRAGLEGAGIAVHLAGRRNPLPLMSDVEAVAAILRERRCDVVVGVGGGSVLDLAKVAAIVAAEGSPAERHAVRFTPPDTIEIPALRAPKLPIVAVPTTFSGSEGNGSGHIRGGAERYARSFRDDAVMPRIVVLDPAAGESQTPSQAVSSALNGLAHCTDGLCVRARSPFTDAISAQGTRMFFSALPGLANDPADPAARLDAQWASLFGGMVIRHSFVGFHHALAHAVGNVSRVAHASANSVLLPHSIAWHLEHLAGEDRERLAAALPAGWRETLAEVTRAAGLPATLAQAGVREEDLASIAHEAMFERPVVNELLPITERALYEVAREAYSHA